MSDRDPRFIAADRPVNRRTALRQAALRDEGTRPAPARVRIAQARNRLGPPLSEQLRAPRAVHGRKPGAQAIAGGMLAACGGLGLFLAWLQASPLGGVAAAGGLAAGLLLARRHGPASALETDAQPRALLEPAAVEAFDDAIERLCAELPDEPMQALAQIKDTVLRVARHPAASSVDEHFRLEDRLYVNECLRRYLPDSLQAYFAVPAQQRRSPLPDGQTPESLLLAQLALLRGELERREAALGRSAAEALLRQERFLKAKAGDQRRL